MNLILQVLFAGTGTVLALLVLLIILQAKGKDPLTRHLERKWDREKLERWQRYTASGQGPVEPVDRYLVFVATKTPLDSGAIRFECQPQRWYGALQCGDRYNRYYGDWSLEGGRELQRVEGGLEEQLWPAGTPVEKLAEAWADYSRQVREINEARLVRHEQKEQERQVEADRRAAADNQKRAQLEEARQLSALLPDLNAPASSAVKSRR